MIRHRNILTAVLPCVLTVLVGLLGVVFLSPAVADEAEGEYGGAHRGDSIPNAALTPVLIPIDAIACRTPSSTSRASRP